MSSFSDIAKAIKESGVMVQSTDDYKEYNRVSCAPSGFQCYGYGIVNVTVSFAKCRNSTALYIQSIDDESWVAFWNGDRFDFVKNNFASSHGDLQNITLDNFIETVKKSGGYANI